MTTLAFRKNLFPATVTLLLLSAPMVLPLEARAAEGTRGGGLGGRTMLDGRPKTDLMGGEGGGLVAIDADGVAGAGGMGSRHPGTGGAPRVTAAAGETVVTSSVTGVNGTCKAPCSSSDVSTARHSGGGGGAGIIGGADTTLTVNTGITVSGGAGGAGNVGTVYDIGPVASNGGGGGGGAGIAVRSGALTLNGNVVGGAGGNSNSYPGGGGDGVVLGSGSIAIGKGVFIDGGQGGVRRGTALPNTASGDGGAGISIGSGNVVNSGIVRGGKPGDRKTPAHSTIGEAGDALRASHDTVLTNKGRMNGRNAVLFEGDNNTLIMWEGSSFVGNVNFAGANNTLTFGSDDGTTPVTKAIQIESGGILNFGTNGTYAVRVTPTAADRLDVLTGTVRLNDASVKVIALDSGAELYDENRDYTILHAGKGFNGDTRFGSVESNLAYLTPSLKYATDATAGSSDVILTLARKSVPVEPGPPSAPVPPEASDPTPPVASDPAPPVASDPAPPVTSDPAPPVASDPAPPAASDPAPPAASDPAPPADSDPAPPADSDPTPPAASDPAPPAASDPAPPAASDPAPPAASDPAPPLASDPVPPVASEPAPPVQGGADQRPIRFADLITGRNAMAVSDAIESLPRTHEIYRRALSLPEDAPQAYFSALTGEAHASTRNALAGLSRPASALPLSHLRANLAAGLQPGAPMAAAGASDMPPAASALPASAARPIWAQLVGNWQRQSASNDNAAVRLHTAGIFVGTDHAIGDGWRLGVALGYTDSRSRIDDADDRSSIASYSASIYGGKAFARGTGTFNLMLGASHTWHDVNTRRRIAVGGLDQTLRADYRAGTTQLFGELGYAMPMNQTLTLEPYAGLAWAGQRNRAFQEKGGSAALSGDSQCIRTTTTTLGMRLRQALSAGAFQGTLTAGAGWRRAFGNLHPVSTLAFDAGEAFTVTGAPIARNAALLETGLQARAGRNATVGLNYAGQFGSGNRDHSAMLNWRWTF
ncbi:autotransporter family protein [Achromobacter xylosoxidans]|uniref:autotransporter family protein n=2 Tax=Alcaligenes xylosoxydans xylosoxydans TaxID=85698 RepID=UPI001EED11AC|nr:autotransporter outer membrane beta-barrel domain-containing protein [Achromobacter xylosoxidans]